MSRRKLIGSLVAGLVGVLVVYVMAFSYIEGRRTRLGPWVVTLQLTGDDVHQLRIDQPALGLTNIWVQLSEPPPGESVVEQVLTFDETRELPFDIPGGRVVFLDLLFQPGTVVLELDGRQIQLLRRVLTIDGREIEWRTDSTNDLRSGRAQLRRASP